MASADWSQRIQSQSTACVDEAHLAWNGGVGDRNLHGHLCHGSVWDSQEYQRVGVGLEDPQRVGKSAAGWDLQCRVAGGPKCPDQAPADVPPPSDDQPQLRSQLGSSRRRGGGG